MQKCYKEVGPKTYKEMSEEVVWLLDKIEEKIGKLDTQQVTVYAHLFIGTCDTFPQKLRHGLLNYALNRARLFLQKEKDMKKLIWFRLWYNMLKKKIKE